MRLSKNIVTKMFVQELCFENSSKMRQVLLPKFTENYKPSIKVMINVPLQSVGERKGISQYYYNKIFLQLCERIGKKRRNCE